MRVVIGEGEILEPKGEKILYLGIQRHRRAWTWGTRQLQTSLLQMVTVKVRISETVNELARLQTRDLSHHHQKQGVAGDIEGHTQKNVCTALIELTTELSVLHVELEDGVTGRKRDLIGFLGIPARD